MFLTIVVEMFRRNTCNNRRNVFALDLPAEVLASVEGFQTIDRQSILPNLGLVLVAGHGVINAFDKVLESVLPDNAGSMRFAIVIKGSRVNASNSIGDVLDLCDRPRQINRSLILAHAGHSDLIVTGSQGISRAADLVIRTL